MVLAAQTNHASNLPSNGPCSSSRNCGARGARRSSSWRHAIGCLEEDQWKTGESSKVGKQRTVSPLHAEQDLVAQLRGPLRGQFANWEASYARNCWGCEQLEMKTMNLHDMGLERTRNNSRFRRRTKPPKLWCVSWSMIALRRRPNSWANWEELCVRPSRPAVMKACQKKPNRNAHRGTLSADNQRLQTQTTIAPMSIKVLPPTSRSQNPMRMKAKRWKCERAWEGKCTNEVCHLLGRMRSKWLQCQ